MAEINLSPVQLEQCRLAFEQSSLCRNKIPFKRGGSTFAEELPAESYVDQRIQAAWVVWCEAWQTALGHLVGLTSEAGVDECAVCFGEGGFAGEDQCPVCHGTGRVYAGTQTAAPGLIKIGEVKISS